jgi:outer membrane protein assembly factor BamD
MAGRHIRDGRTRGILRTVLGVVLVAGTLMSGACAGGVMQAPTGTLEPDKFLFEKGTEALNKRRWLVARVYFRDLIDTYPQTSYRADAKLGIGDTYVGERTAESSVLALNEFREFLNFYPTHRRGDYAQFKMGMVHFNQMHSPDRDQTETREAIQELTMFVEKYPNSSLLEEGKQKLREARDRLSQYEYNVGYHYYRQRWYPGAVDRLETLLKTDPQFTRRDAVYFYLGESYFKTKNSAQALPYFDRLLKEFEQSEFLVEAQKRVEVIKAELAKKAETVQ